MKQQYTYEDLKDIMGTLRGEQGCPWDLKQTHDTLLQHLLEETYEVIDAVKKRNMDGLCEELGDVLLQVVFHSQIAAEASQFTMEDVVDGICRKLITRHTHIFGDVVAKTSEDVKKNWEKIKKEEKGYNTHTQILQSVPEVFPALMRAYKVQAKAGEVGFDWDRVEDAMVKVEEEWGELKEVLQDVNKERIMEEYGDLLFAVVNIARFLKINPEFALTKSTEKFINRFEHIENTAIHVGKQLHMMTLSEMDELWEEAKKAEINRPTVKIKRNVNEEELS